MNPFIKQELDHKTAAFYDKHYTVLEWKLLNYTDWVYLGDEHSKKCRFCGRTEKDGATFNKIAHCFPESIGNHFLASYYECDSCNSFFGDTIESDFGNFMNLYHSISQIRGKKKIPDHISTDRQSKITQSSGLPILSVVSEDEEKEKEPDNSNSPHVTIRGNHIEYTDVAPTHYPIAVFKCFVKMALSVIPESELPSFQDTILWLREKRHSNIFKYKKLLCRYKFIPGYNTTKYPCYWLFKRKGVSQCAIYPRYVFCITYGNFSYAIEVPVTSELNHSIKDVPFPPLPFVTESENYIDLSSPSKVSDFTQKVCLTVSGGFKAVKPEELSDDILGKAKIK